MNKQSSLSTIYWYTHLIKLYVALVIKVVESCLSHCNIINQSSFECLVTAWHATEALQLVRNVQMVKHFFYYVMNCKYSITLEAHYSNAHT